MENVLWVIFRKSWRKDGGVLSSSMRIDSLQAVSKFFKDIIGDK